MSTRFLSMGLAVGSVWLAVLIASLYAPVMITGSNHERLAIAPLADWLWGALATGLLLLAAAFTQARTGRDLADGRARHRVRVVRRRGQQRLRARSRDRDRPDDHPAGGHARSDRGGSRHGLHRRLRGGDGGA